MRYFFKLWESSDYLRSGNSCVLLNSPCNVSHISSQIRRIFRMIKKLIESFKLYLKKWQILDTFQERRYSARKAILIFNCIFWGWNIRNSGNKTSVILREGQPPRAFLHLSVHPRRGRRGAIGNYQNAITSPRLIKGGLAHLLGDRRQCAARGTPRYGESIPTNRAVLEPPPPPPKWSAQQQPYFYR